MITIDNNFEDYIEKNDVQNIQLILNKRQKYTQEDQKLLNWGFIHSSSCGFLKIIETLLNNNLVDPSENNCLAFRMAAENGYLNIVKLLLKDKRVNPAVCNNNAVIISSISQHLDITRLLLKDKRVNPTDEKNQAIFILFKKHYIKKDFSIEPSEIIKLLWNEQRVKNTLQNHHPYIYSHLTNIDIKNKVGNF
jgi:hypothetical protein